MLQAYSVQHFQKMNSFTDVFFKNFAYFFGITILRNISEWQGSNAVLNHKEQMKDEKKESYWSQNRQGIERASMVQKLPAKKCLYN